MSECRWEWHFPVDMRKFESVVIDTIPSAESFTAAGLTVMW
jgi:hypothetical protein